VGKTTVTTDSSGHADFGFMADQHSPVAKDPNTGDCEAAPFLTATATDVIEGNTSEFSQWVEVAIQGSAKAYAKRCDE
jgi:hypothetical protein